MSTESFVRRRAQRLTASGATVGLAAAAIFVPHAANAAVIEQSFTVTCEQEYVSDEPFDVQVDVAVTLPDTIYVGDVITPIVSLDLTLPPEVADVITRNNYDTLEGLVDATVSIDAPSGASEANTAYDFALAPTVVPDPAASFLIESTPAFQSYTTTEPGVHAVSLTGAFVTVHDVVVTDSANDSTFSLEPFYCSTETEFVVGTATVLPALPVEEPAVEEPAVVESPVVVDVPVTPRPPVVSG